jgi:hypothetical protein
MKYKNEIWFVAIILLLLTAGTLGFTLLFKILGIA